MRREKPEFGVVRFMPILGGNNILLFFLRFLDCPNDTGYPFRKAAVEQDPFG
jgi:hypothetical protein